MIKRIFFNLTLAPTRSFRSDLVKLGVFHGRFRRLSAIFRLLVWLLITGKID